MIGVVKSMSGKWKAGIQDGKPMRMSVLIPKSRIIQRVLTLCFAIQAVKTAWNNLIIEFHPQIFRYYPKIQLLKLFSVNAIFEKCCEKCWLY